MKFSVNLIILILIFVEHEKYKENINRELLVLLFDIALTVM